MTFAVFVLFVVELPIRDPNPRGKDEAVLPQIVFLLPNRVDSTVDAAILATNCQ